MAVSPTVRIKVSGARGQRGFTGADGVEISGLMGVPPFSANMGTTPGTILSDNGTAKDWFQESEAAIEDRPTSATLAADSGSSLIGYKRPSLTGAASRTGQSKNGDRFDLRDMAGLDLTGANSMTTLLQAAVDHSIANKVPLHIPVGKITLDAPININNSLAIIGESCGTGKALAGYNGVAVTTATQFHLAHNGKGFALDGGGQVFDWVLFRDIMTTRIQPTPTEVVGSFVPGDQDFDFDVYNAAGLQLQNVCMLNPARGVNMRGGGSIGRLWCDNVMGQPLRTGIKVELAADVCRLSNVHFWPFWQDQIEVARWTLENCDHLWLERCDTPLLSNYFSIAARSGVRFSQGTYGVSKKGMGTNLDIDYCQYGLWFDSTCDGAWFTATNLSIQGAGATALANTPGISNRVNILMEGDNPNYLHVTNMELGGSTGSAVKLTTANQHIEVHGKNWMHTYGETVGNVEAGISVAENSTYYTASRIFNEAPGAGPLIGGAGRIMGIERDWTPSITPQSGSLSSVTINTAKFIDDGSRVMGTFTFTVNTVGTATGYIRVSAPTQITNTFPATVFDLAGPLMAGVSILGTPGLIQVQNVAGGDVATAGRVIIASFSYTVPN